MIVVFDRADSADIYYRLHWNSDCHVLYVERGEKRTVHVPGFEYLRARREILGDIAVERLENLKETLATLRGPFTVPKTLPYAVAELLEGGIEAVREVFPERRVKSLDEIAAIEDAQKAAAEAIALVERRLAAATIVDGVATIDGAALTAEALKTEARAHLIAQGYDCSDLIISSGRQTAMPHDRGSGPIREGPVIVDIFPRSERSRYHGDMTRTFVVGSDENAERMLAAVRAAHDAIILLCVPGAKCSDLHAEAERLLAEHGFATGEEHGLIHSLGHGLGLDIHEAPNISTKSEDVLVENMTITVEPGLYYENGVRHENVVVVRDKPLLLSL